MQMHLIQITYIYIDRCTHKCLDAYVYFQDEVIFCCLHLQTLLVLNIDLMLLNAWTGNMLSFSVDGKQAFEVSLADVSQSQLQGKNDVLLEFHVDDTTGANEVCLYTQRVLVGCIEWL